MLVFLLKRGSQPNKDLLTAARLKDDQVFNMLITAGANIDETFIMACKQNDSSVEYLIRKGADINTCMSNEKNYPLIIASQNKNENVFNMLIENGVDTDKPFRYMLEQSDNITVQSFLEVLNNLSLSVFNKCFRDPYHTKLILIEATKYGFDKIVARVIYIGISHEVIQSILAVACKYNSDAISTLLIDKGYREATCETFKLGFKTEDINIIRSLVNAGGRVNDTDIQNWSPLSWACFYRHENIVYNKTCIQKIDGIIDYLIEKGADVNFSLSLACIEGHFTAVEFLIHKGGNPNFKDTHGHSLLENAAKQGYHNIVMVLKSHGATYTEQESKCVLQ